MTKKWFSVAEVAEMLGFGETKVRMAIIQGDLRSVKDGKLRRIQMSGSGSGASDDNVSSSAFAGARP